MRRETCIWERPTRWAIWVCGSPSSKRIRRISRSRAGSRSSAGASAARCSERSNPASSVPIVSIGSRSSSPLGPLESETVE